MGYEPHLIADFKAIDKEKQPWLIPDDAQESLIDGYTHHGVINKRDGYNFFANGGEGGVPYCESRIVARISNVAMNGVIDSNNQIFTLTATAPIRRGGFTVVGDNPVQSVIDNGEGGFSGDGTGTIDYNTGVISVTFTAAPIAASTVIAAYDYHPGNPVMMIANFVTENNTKDLLVADTKYLNKYNPATNRFDYIPLDNLFTGTSHEFFTWAQYPTILDTPRLLFTNNVDQIKAYDGTNVIDWYPVITATAVSGEVFGSGNGTTGPYLNAASNVPVMPTTVVITADPGAGQQVVTDDGVGNLTGNGTGTVNYTTGDIVVTFTNVVPVGVDNITLDYSYGTDYVITCQTLLDFKDRITLYRTTEIGGVPHPQRIRISGLGQSGDDLRTTASGAGAIDIPTPHWIQGAVFNRDDVMFFTNRETWLLKYSGNDIVPFVPGKVDGTRGNRPAFGPISYLNLTKGYSPYGFIVSDGYQVNRYDDRIPDFSYDEIDQDNFDLCFSGTVEDDKNHYLLYPSQGETESNKILVNNYEENNFAIYDLPLSCMGVYFESLDITWVDLLKYDSWEEFSQAYATWNDIGYAKDQPISLGGGHKGEIWRLNGEESEDNALKIWGITDNATTPATVEVDSDWHNYKVGDRVFFAGLGGAIEINNKIAQITELTAGSDTKFTVQFETSNPETISAYTSGGSVSRVIPFGFTTKNFNPYVQAGEKVRCGWINIYIDASRSLATDVKGNYNPAKIKLEVFSNDSGVPTQVTSIDIPIEANIGNFDNRKSRKVWRKVYINQTSRFLQFRVSNYQPGTRVRIHALEPGFMPGGRMI